MLTTLILVRHGETVWNKQHRFQGHLDSPLTRLGQAQADQTAERLTTEQVSAIYSSDSGRAMQTATAIAKRLSLTVLPDPRLREMDVGAWGGLNDEEIKARYLEEWQAWQHDHTMARGGGENQTQVQDRGVEVIQAVAVAHPGEVVVLVSHGGTLKSIVAWVMGLPLEYWPNFRGPGNCNLTYLEHVPASQRFRLLNYNVPATGVMPLADDLLNEESQETKG
jgi:broad specificity phosphatase PhoE